MAPRPCAAASSRSIRSTASLVAPYVLVGRVVDVSRIGTSSGSPYTAAVDENTKRGTPYFVTASSNSLVPQTLLCQYSEGSTIDCPTSDFAARCTTPSNAAALRTSPAVVMSASTNEAPAATASACPVERSSRTVTCVEQETADDTADVPGTAGDEQIHRADPSSARSRSMSPRSGVAVRIALATSSGCTSLMNAPIADSDPARYFSLPGARRMENSSRCKYPRSRSTRTGA